MIINTITRSVMSTMDTVDITLRVMVFMNNSPLRRNRMRINWLPALALLGNGASTNLPLQLDRTKPGEAALVGTVSGNLNDPQFRGQATVTNASIEGHGFDRFSSRILFTVRSLIFI